MGDTPLNSVEPASFRDPSGFVYRRDGLLLRQVNRSYSAEYDLLMSSGLYEDLASNDLLIPHDELPLALASTDAAVRVLRPEVIPFVSYPHEWCFGQLKAAAQLTLDVQRRAVGRGLILKDASASNVQFRDGRPIFIDTLSFERYVTDQPWIAYRQFCQHFIAPLLLMSHVDVRLGGLVKQHLDGIPLDLASRLLPTRTWLRLTPAIHIHAHARSVQRHAQRVDSETPSVRLARQGLMRLIDSLDEFVTGADWDPRGTEWANYATDNTYTSESREAKNQLVADYLGSPSSQKDTVWDLGANVGQHSRIAARKGFRVLSFDLDPAAVERNFRAVTAAGETRILPLIQDLMNPSGSSGWAGRERMSLERRGPASVVLALALVHHLAIGNNVPLPGIAEYFSKLAPVVIVEFVSKRDAQVRRMLASRADIFADYTREAFEAAFGRFFRCCRSDALGDSGRILYRFEGQP